MLNKYSKRPIPQSDSDEDDSERVFSEVNPNNRFSEKRLSHKKSQSKKKKPGRPKIPTKSNIYYGWDLRAWFFKFSFNDQISIKIIKGGKILNLEDYSHQIFSKLDGVLDGSCNIDHRKYLRDFAEGISESVYMEKLKRLDEKYKITRLDNGIFVPLNEFGIQRPDVDWQKKILRSQDDIENAINYEKVYKEWIIVDLYHNQEKTMDYIIRKLKVSQYKVSTCAAFFARTGSLPTFEKIKSQRSWPS